MIYKTLFTLLIFSFMSLIPIGAYADDLSLEKAVICLDVIDRTPIGEALEFDSSTTKVYCFNVVIGAKTPSRVTHVWYYKGKKVREMTLPVSAYRWRTWSNKNIFPGQVGPWSVEIIDTDRHEVISTLHFSVQ